MSTSAPSRDLAVASAHMLHAFLRNSCPRWTHALPAREGYYWMKQPKGYGEVMVVRVLVDYSEPTTPFVIQIGDRATTGVQYLLDQVGCQWCGPLEVPIDAA